MSEFWERPRVEEMMIYLFPRAIHPEFFCSATHRLVERPEFTLHVTLTLTGHLLTWKRNDCLLTEVTAAKTQELPKQKFVLKRRFDGEQRGQHPIAEGFLYHVATQREVLTPELFVDQHQELIREGSRKGMFHSFGPANRFRLPALSWISVEGSQDTIVVQSCHTFPEEWTVIRTQSLIERKRT